MKAKPLLDKTILAACSEKKMAELVVGLEAMGGKVIPFPVIEVRDIEDKRLLDLALDSIDEYAWIIFTSVHGVSFFMQRLDERGIGSVPHSMPRICAIGPATAKAVNESGYKVALIPERFVAEGIIEALGKYSGGLNSLVGKRILLARAKEGREILPEELRASGVLVDVVPCYQTVRPDFPEGRVQQLRRLRPDLIVFTSSSALRNMIDIIGQEDGKRMILESIVAVLGPVTGNTAASFGKCAEIVPKANTIASLLTEIYEFYSGGNSSVDIPQ
jgi:uroporphyrinogen III methyltransferase/synthase